MYFDKAEDNTPIEADLPMRIALSVNGLVILMLGLLPHSLMQLCLNTMIF
jgi:NADH-quinone oxidoreductase subunit N